MPTGYTAIIEDKKDVTFNDYILRCARAFGACVGMREESMDKPLPKELKVSPYHKDELEKAEVKLLELDSLTAIALEDEAEKEYKRELRSIKAGLKESNEKAKRYDDIMREVKMWIPPTEDHIGLKDFMISQIEDSNEYVNPDYYQEELDELKTVTGKQWYDKEIKQINRDIKYHTKEYRKELKRTADRNKWLKELWKSLK